MSKFKDIFNNISIACNAQSDTKPKQLSMLSVLKELENRTDENPHKLLYVFLDINGKIKESYTYREFQQKTNRTASHIHNSYSFNPGDRILLAYSPGLEMICAFFSCVRLGLIPVPVYPPSTYGFEASIQKMNFIAQDCGAKAILTDSSFYWSIQANLARKNIATFYSNSDGISKLKWIMSDDTNVAESINFPIGHSDILFLQYTSGSTNNPKGVVVTHQNIIHNCANVVDHLPIGVSWLPQYHDMGLIGYYIFFALKGGTTYGFSAIDFIQRPALWLETISKYSGTASSAPNFAYEYCLIPGKIPEKTFENLNLSSLKFLMTAAEPINTKVYADFINKFQTYGLNPKSFFAAYGLAEFTLAVTNYGRDYHSCDSKSLKEHHVKILNSKETDFNSTSLMSCGKPLGDTKIMIVDISSSPKEAKQGEVGEIWLNGLSKCEGYWNKPELTKETFEAQLIAEPNAERWLRTGDLGFLFNNELYVCGRVKDMIIIRGLNYYPQDIESIVEEDSFVRKGCVSAFSIEENGYESLVVLVGLKSNNKISDAHSINNKIIKYLGISADKFVFVPARTISKTSSGKIMRYQNKNRFLTGDLQIISLVDLKEKDSDKYLDELNGVKTIFKKKNDTLSLFTKYGLTGKEHQSLGDAGLDSLKLAEFSHDLKEHIDLNGFNDLSHEVDLRLIQKIAVSELYQILEGLQSSNHLSRFSFKNAFTHLYKEHEKAEKEMMKKDALSSVVIERSFNFSDEKKKLYSENFSHGHILLTGGTGFFGPFLMRSLIDQNQEDIYVLLRADNVADGLNRLREAFNLTNPSNELKENFEKRIKPVCGDISQTKLGLEETDWDFLATNIHTIYHNGALVNYLLDYELMRNANVNGTLEIIRLALSSRPKVLNHISTTFIFGWSVKDTLFESDENGKMENLDFGYSQSKWSSEQIVINAMRNGLHARIFRPALISPSVKGEGYNFDISIRLLAFMVKYGIGTSAQNQVSFTPADIAANNIVAISNLKESLNLTFHVTRDDFSSMKDVTDILGEMIGKPFLNFPLKEYVPEVVSRCQKDDLLFPLLNFLVRSESKISAMEFKRYDNSNYTEFRDISVYGKKDPPLDAVVKGIYLFMMSQGIIENTIKSENYV